MMIIIIAFYVPVLCWVTWYYSYYIFIYLFITSKLCV